MLWDLSPVPPACAAHIDLARHSDDEISGRLRQELDLAARRGTGEWRVGQFGLGRGWRSVHEVLLAVAEDETSSLMEAAIYGTYRFDGEAYHEPADVERVFVALRDLSRSRIITAFCEIYPKEDPLEAHAFVDLIEELRDVYGLLAQRGCGAWITIG